MRELLIKKILKAKAEENGFTGPRWKEVNFDDGSPSSPRVRHVSDVPVESLPAPDLLSLWELIILTRNDNAHTYATETVYVNVKDMEEERNMHSHWKEGNDPNPDGPVIEHFKD